MSVTEATITINLTVDFLLALNLALVLRFVFDLQPLTANPTLIAF